MHNNIKLINNILLFILTLLFITLINGALPFYSIPTLGQIVWASGFAESFAQNHYWFHANNFGIPHLASMPFGLPGAYLQSLFIKYFHLHASDAYSFMTILILAISLWGSLKFSSLLGATYRQGLLFSLIYLTLPIVWWHTQYSFLAFGFAFLPFYLFSAFSIVYAYISKDYIDKVIIFILLSIFAIFMDGYTFMMFATATMIIFIVSIFNCRATLKDNIIKLITIAVSFVTAYILYTKYVGVTSFDAWPMDYFRGFGVDISMFLVPSTGVMWLFDLLGLSQSRSGMHYYGDASVWATTFILPLLIVGILSYMFSTYNKYKLSLFLIALFGFYMSLGPSLKMNSTRSTEQILKKNFTPSMTQSEAICLTGNGVLYKYLPGFKSTRATYRWSGLLFVGLYGLVIIGILQLSKRNKKRAYLLIFILVLFNLPDIGKRIKMAHANRQAMFNMDLGIIKSLQKNLSINSKVAFVPYYNDHFVNYLAAKAQIRTYNIGGDKNLELAKKYWPETMLSFNQLHPGPQFIQNIKNILINKDANSVIIPYIDMLWSAYSWPRKTSEIIQRKKRYEKYIEYFQHNHNFVLIKDKLYTIIKLSQSADLKSLKEEYHSMKNCNLNECVYEETNLFNKVYHIVGIVKKDSIETDGRSGTLLFGPYRNINKGVYTLCINGYSTKKDNKFEIYLTSNLGKDILKKFKININKIGNFNLKFDSINMQKNIKGLEIKFTVENDTNMKIYKYKLIKDIAK